MKRNSDGETGPAAKRLRPMGDTELRLLVYSKVNQKEKKNRTTFLNVKDLKMEFSNRLMLNFFNNNN